jgi:two-component system, LuxR family, sensor kinase FixL
MGEAGGKGVSRVGDARHAHLLMRAMLAFGIVVLVVSAWFSYRTIEQSSAALAIATGIALAGLALLVAAVFAMRRDALDRVLAEAAQRATEARLGAIVDSVMDAIISIDEQQRVLLFNAAAQRMFGVDQAAALGEPLDRFLPDRFRTLHRKHVHAFQHTGVTKRRMGALGPLSALRANGEEFPIEASISQATIEGHRVFTVVLRDITERESMQTELQLAQHRLTHMARLSTMGEMASGLSHEINQPLTAIATYAQALERLAASDAGLDREELREATHQIATQALRAGEVIRRLKAMIKNREPDFHAIDCHELISDVLALAKIDARLQRAELRSSGAYRGIQVRGDAVQLQQVLINLIRNSLDALGDLPPERRIITVAVRVENDGVEFSVVDHGGGLPGGVARESFGPFFTTKTQGTGLGLAISRSIIEAHRGRLTHRETPGGGTTFSFSLPLSSAMEAV